MDRYADGTYAERHPGWHAADGPWKAERVARLLDDHGIAPTSACDLGCGSGAVLTALSARWPGARLVGFDPAGQLAWGERDGVGPVLLVQGDGSGDDERFDVALSLDVVEHVPEVEPLLASLARKAPLVVLHIPLNRSLQAQVRPGAFDRLLESMGHVRYFTRRSALAMLRSAGYEVVDARLTDAFRVDRPLTAIARVGRLPRSVTWRIDPRVCARVWGGCSLLVLARPGASA